MIRKKLKYKDYIYVYVQFILLIIYLLHIDLVQINILNSIRYIGIVIVFIGSLTAIIAMLQLNDKLSPFPSTKSNATLITNGIYRFIRHLIYTGIILITLGYSFYSSSLYSIIISTLLYTLFYYKSSYEEQCLKISFPDYKSYQKKSDLFFPER